MLTVLESANLALRFLLELCALASVAYWGFRTGNHIALKILLGIGAPVLLAVVWGTFGAPKAAIPLNGVGHLFLEIAVFGLSAAALYAAGRPILAWIFISLVILNRVLMYVWGQ